MSFHARLQTVVAGSEGGSIDVPLAELDSGLRVVSRRLEDLSRQVDKYTPSRLSPRVQEGMDRR